MAAGRWANEDADPRSLLHALLGQLHGLLSDALTANRANLFPRSEPERLTRIYIAVSATIGEAQALVDRLDQKMLRSAGTPAEMLELMLWRWREDRQAYESQPTRRPDDLARSVRTADDLLLHDLMAVVPQLQEIRGWLRLLLSELEAPGGSALMFSASEPGVDPAPAPMATTDDSGWRVDERTDEPVLEPGLSRG